MRVEEEKSIEDRQEEEPKKVEAPVPAKPPMDARFQVKRAVRPTMPQNMLEDLEKMKKKMMGTNNLKPPLAAAASEYASFKPAPRFLQDGP